MYKSLEEMQLLNNFLWSEEIILNVNVILQCCTDWQPS